MKGLIVLLVLTCIVCVAKAYHNWKAEYRKVGAASSTAHLQRDRVIRYVFGFVFTLLLVISHYTCTGQSVFVGYSQRYNATVAIDTSLLSATIVTPNDTIVLYGSRIINYNGLILLVEGQRTLARICVSNDCKQYPQATWCSTCGNQRRRYDKRSDN